MLSLFKKKKVVEAIPEYAESAVHEVPVMSSVEKIHNEFNCAGDHILDEAKKIIDESVLKKAGKLEKAGFLKSPEIARASTMKISKELADLVIYYKSRYVNKFITRGQANAICNKYGLVCGPVSAYTGFVPVEKLNQIVDFIVKKEDEPVNLCIPKFKHEKLDDAGIQKLKAKYPDLIIPESIIIRGQIKGFGGGHGFITVYEYDLIGSREKMICAPMKDMDMTGLKEVEGHFFNVEKVHIPDPVVLQPVKDGFLILAAWGDEASDEIVVNQAQN